MKKTRTRGQAGAAYGFRIDGIRPSEFTLSRAPEGWPVVHLRQTQEAHAPVDYRISGTSVVVPLITGGRLELDGERMIADFRVPATLTSDDLLHPYFAPAGAWFAHWLGRHCFHAGAVVLNENAYVVLGEKEAGKSSLLAWLAASGVPVLADDLVVVEGRNVLTGPRCIDLRPPAVEALAQVEGAALVRGDTRHRVRLAQTAPQWPLGGWIFLEWGDRPSLTVVPPRERLRSLSTHRVYKVPPLDPADLLAFAALPAWKLTRPRGWNLMDDVAGLVSGTVGG